MKNLLRSDLTFRMNGRLWVESSEERFMGIGRLELLEKIEATGSISKAAQAMNMSYKRAWDLVSSMNTQANKPLVITQTGGKSGGGALVTEEGKQAIQAFQAMQERFRQFMEAETQRLNG
ncbi:winged helix-turn-helix domain-containing protein [Hymenobacter sp. BT491]|uniref:winged helix-turn-helix domain-containing protein n=1 Tax=Hymenobacter sp. BT491 TaxID=2766779 RepID=UPI00165347E8|nr:LysR family transcriptional regulator [Hymenobacter sp. BT491]MBC6989496.1 LysR family transcriptional regulator [Hymenobacter sp. BT491]